MVPLISLLLLSNGAHSSTINVSNYNVNVHVTCELSTKTENDFKCVASCGDIKLEHWPITINDTHTKCFVNTMTHVEANVSDKYVWLYGFGSATLLNVASISGIAFSPIIQKSYFPWILLGMMGIGFGSMISVSVLNLLPVVMDNGDVEMKFPVIVLVSIFVFYMCDQILRFWQFDREEACVSAITNNDEDNSSTRRVTGVNSLSEENKITNIIIPVKSIKDIPAIVYMVLISDGLHNFVDGLAIGAAFRGDPKSAIGLVLAILFEEVPCELGDFALFLKAGLAVRHAVILNFVGACTNYIGVAIGISIGDNEMIHRYIYAIAGGMFMYISLSIILVEIVDIQTKMTKLATYGFVGKTKKHALKDTLLKSGNVVIWGKYDYMAEACRQHETTTYQRITKAETKNVHQTFATPLDL
ncbi:hypothetical protein GJ496_006441 [Pomphorhynchus laevis]|nr:hypothetical protein GJ496_006441 [Pomphorhynchus laevis]